jgi:hypothetical protein
MGNHICTPECYRHYIVTNLFHFPPGTYERRLQIRVRHAARKRRRGW